MKIQAVEFFNRLTSIRSWDQFVFFFEHQPLPIQILIGLTIFGICYLVYVFFAGALMDNDE